MGRTWTPSQEAAMRLDGKTLLVSAAAGSGKTSVLTERIIRKLTDTEHPADLSRMLIVTFTRAAAAELKGRIAKALTDAMAKDPENAHLSRQLFLLGSAQISTIDSFFQKAVRANFERLSLPASFRMADEAEVLPIATEIMDGLLEEYYDRYAQDIAQNSPFAKLQNNPFAQTLDNLMSGRSDGKLDSVLRDFLTRFSAEPEGVEILGRFAKELNDAANAEYFSTSYGLIVREYLCELFEGYIVFLKKTMAHLDATPDMCAKYIGIVESDLNYCYAMKKALHEGIYEHAREVAYTFVSGRFPTSKEKTNEILLYQDWRKKFKSDIEKRVQDLLQYPVEIIAEQMRLTALPTQILWRFYSEYTARLLSEKLERGLLEFDDVRAMLYKLLTDKDGNPTPFAEELASSYDAVYIDEYQDVDYLQDRIFALIGKNRRFMVGDIKQSIYGFRGSEPSIFAGYRREMPLYTEPDAEDADGICVFMSDNFRCDKPVIEFANKVCAFLFSACEKTVGYRPQDDLVCSKSIDAITAPEHPVPVTLAVFDAPPRKKSKEDTDDDTEDVREEAVWVAAEISRLLREEKLDNGAPIRPSDIAILVRNKNHGATYTDELAKLGIPVLSPTSSDMAQDPLLYDMLNLLKSVDNPWRDLPLSEFLLSPIGEFDLEELSEIRASAESSVALYDALLTVAEDENHPLTSKCNTVIAWLDDMRRLANTQPADRFLRLLYQEDRIAHLSDKPVLLYLYEQARIYQKNAFCGLYGFLSHFTKLLEGDKLNGEGFGAAEDAVTVMTVHHSKGLEFPVVFLSSTGSPFNKDDLKKNLLYHREVGIACKLYNEASGNLEDTALRAALCLKVDHEQIEESIRTLYVALTRARERMYITGTLSGKWETAMTNASLIQRGNRASILGASNMLSWILAALFEGGKLDENLPLTLVHPLLGEVERGLPVSFGATAPENEAALSPVAERYAAIYRAKETMQYPFAFLQGMPTKAAASKLSADLLDRLSNKEDEEGALEAQIALLQSATQPFDSLLQAQEKPSATEIGSATHAFLQFCNYERLMKTSTAEEAERLVADGFMSRRAADILHHKQLKAFCESDLMVLIQMATRVQRELKFGVLTPMRELTQNEDLARRLGDETLFVQGSIDLLLTMPDGRLILVDYKTDHISDEERANPTLLTKRLKERHGHQLNCYAEAVCDLFGRAPDEVRIYSLPLGASLLIE